MADIAPTISQAVDPTHVIELYPAIDLLGGRAVRLARGNYDAVTVYNEDPLAQAALFKAAGARWLHVVDLDAARGDGNENRRTVQSIIERSELQVEVGGGVRDMLTIEWLIAAGAKRIIMGTSLITDRTLVLKAIERFGDAICAAIDARNGKVAISGWIEQSSVDALELAQELSELGIRHFLYTDINRDGLQSGIDIEAYRLMSERTTCPIIVSGGVATLDDIRAVNTLGSSAEAVIVGRALYEQNFTVQAALEILDHG
ncbi:MAG: 1-(5-phosphoribosyl)-5-[(5-phosphoribosylamino)methylideneamino]imidazole-4-carboxamide isomerase [Coriobacteriia bacterium]|nr:1-(5-phosphoribosyl)-5-[(5-phosphoribosylamino)methylideneamino]imidazole-4-carboxamide isomerase [Coriobacteriia bacterium]